MARKPEKRTLKNSVRIAARQQKVRQYRLAGWDNLRIAKTLEISVATVVKDIQEICKNLMPSSDRQELRAFEIARIDDIYSRLYNVAIAENVLPADMDISAPPPIISLSPELRHWSMFRAKLLGIDRPEADDTGGQEGYMRARQRVDDALVAFEKQVEADRAKA